MIDGNIDVVSLTGDITDSVSLEGELLPIGPKGDKGDPGFSPVVTTSKSGKTTTIKFETATGNVYAEIQDGEDGQGSGDMLTDVYDQNKNGIVDNAEKVNNHTVEKDVPANAVFTDTVYDDTEVRGLINAKPSFSDIPTKVSDLTNDSGFIDNTVNNLTNYYLKTETYTKIEINNLIAQIPGFNVEVVQTLPVSDIDTHTIYLVPKTGSTGDIYDEYLYINNSWELIGNTAVDLTDYVKFTNYATNSKGGVIKTDTSAYGTAMYSGYLTGSTKTYAQYGSSANALFVSKGTLENVITGKELVNKDANNLTNYANVNESAQTTETNVSSATFTNILEAPMEIDLKGNTLQNGTPTPSLPIPINNVSGDNDIVVSNGDSDTTTYNIDLPVENMINLDDTNVNNAYETDSVVVLPNKTYTISYKKERISGATISNNQVYGIGYIVYYNNNTEISRENGTVVTLPSGSTNIVKTFTTPNNCNRIIINIGNNNGDKNVNTKVSNIQIEQGSKANAYTPYGTTPIELNKIGTYQDYIYKENGKWYLHKEIGKVVLDTLTWFQESNASSKRYHTTGISNLIVKPPANNQTLDTFSNIYIKNNATWTWQATTGKGIGIQMNGDLVVFDDSYTSSSDLTNFTTMLTNTNAILEYPLATPTTTEITYTPLIEQLESIKNAMSKEGTTNVNQVNNDAPFILDLSVFNDTYNGRYQSVLEMYKRLKEAE